MDKIQSPEPGIYYDIPFNVYVTWDAANDSMLRRFVTHSPAHVKAYADHPPLASAAFVEGEVFHALLLEPMEFDGRYAVAPKVDRRTKAGKAAWAEFEASADGKTVVDQRIFAETSSMVYAAQSHKLAWNLLRSGNSEVCIVWDDPETGVRCKARLDYLHGQRPIITDAKSTRDARPEKFERDAYNYGYHQKAAFYFDGYGILTKTPAQEMAFMFVAVEKTPPYGVIVYKESTQGLQQGARDYRYALQCYKQCIETGEWPSYPERINLLTLPRWAQDEDA